ncbi:hypothetical protein HUT19_11125 [Streptomyces sp. NA02950]|uniref:hypothetical protein n=1 Tax=Streptomyces sp. NA02950 TaxID=2742137 RepID=UPI001592880F|nr:hypothetical protein [Streptomyces sp. NA02950]QKV92229.1 hypothetical protein HUT19_11125 [Streptomyces sp. NA02950]
MPLPFLTADHALDEETGGAPDDPAYEDLDRWRRPYRPGPWRVGGAALLLLLASYVLFSAMIIAMAGSLPAAGFCVAVAALVIMFAVRVVHSGVQVSAHGLRQVGVFASTTVAWPHIAAIRTAQQPVRWLGLPRTVQGQAVIAEPAGGGETRVLISSHSADFLARPEGFDMAADALEGWAAAYRR